MWFIYALAGAAFKALTAYFRKHVSSRMDGDVYAWMTIVLSFPFLVVAVLIFETSAIDLAQERSWQILGASITWVLGLLFSIAAYKREELSYIAPLNSFIPIITAIVAWVAIGESIPLLGISGVIFVFLGAYVINLQPNQIKWDEPLIHIFKSSGARFAIAVALMLGVNSVITKSVTNDGRFTALDFMIAVSVVSWILLAYVPFRKKNQLVKAIRSHKIVLLIMTITGLFSSLFAILSLESAFASYAISVRRFDVIFAVILGWKILKEKNIRNKIIGSVFMIIGSIVLALS